MFCLRSWLPLLFIPTNASPAFIFLFFVCTYFLNRPCFFDFSSNWFAPRSSTSYYECTGNCTTIVEGEKGFNETAVEMLNTTASALASAAADELTRRKAEWTGLGIEWLRSLLGRREWRIECMDVNIRL
ncbi:hypothetical protein SCUP234_08660 [Seiridium cupressi]